MCGIVGVAGPGGVGDLKASISALRHRGPDDQGLWSDDLCTLGHVRLAIIDLSDSGNQPMSNEDGTVWLSYNGEVYNYRELRDQLRQRGHTFRSATDSEILVHAYEEWDTDFVKRLQGMFAFAIWDRRRRRLVLGRDRVGKKPLYYSVKDDRIWFASEMQGLLGAPGVARDVDREAIDGYLTYGYVPGTATGLRGIQKLAPGHLLTADLSDGHLSVNLHEYWRLEHLPKLDLGPREAAEHLRTLMDRAVRRRLVSDVPLGAFLSGGIDSSIVVGLMAQAVSQPVRTFSIGFDDHDYNELEHARRIATRWGTDHTEHVVRPDATAILPSLVRHYGEPFADSSAVPTFYVAQQTRHHVTVALSGDGGDESFAGYERYWGMELAGRVQGVPLGARLAKAAAALLPIGGDPKRVPARAHRFLAAAAQPAADRYVRWSSYFQEEDKHALYGPTLSPLLDGPAASQWMRDLFASTAGLRPAEAAMAVDIRSYLPYDLLAKVDIASMMSSLEVRCPFLDTDVMEFAARLPLEHKLRGRQGKRLLLEAFAGLLPRENVARAKMGFGVPIGRWFRGPLREMLQDTVLSRRALDRGYFREGPLRNMVNDHLAGTTDHTARLWSLLMLELWHIEIVEQPTSAPVL